MNVAKPIPFKPWTGLLDRRSAPDLMPSGSFRRRLNWMVRESGKLERRDGLLRLGSGNDDLHDQMLALVTGAGHEFVTFQMEVVTSWGTRYLLEGTATRLYQRNETTHNWRLLGSGFSAGRWHAAQVLDTVILTNGVDVPVYYEIDAEADEDGQTVQAITDLALIGLSRAACVIEFKGLVIFGNLVLDGQPQESALLWSDRLAPLVWDSSKEGVQGSQVLGTGEKILGMTRNGDYLRVYTNQRIWQGSATGDPEQPLAFVTLYESPAGALGYRCLSYPNTLVSTGDEDWYVSRDGIYTVNGYTAPGNPPERREWAHLASGDMFRDLDPQNCLAHVGFYWSDRNEVQFFWATAGSSVPVYGLGLELEDHTAHDLDYGLTAGCEFRSDARMSFGDWLLSVCACALDDLGDSYDMEGLPPADASFIPTSCDVFTNVRTADVLTIDGLETEDWSVSGPDADAWSAQDGVAGVRTDALCATCNEQPLLIVASADDGCLKQAGGAYRRDVCTNAASGLGTLAAGRYTPFTGTYRQDGYLSVILSGPLGLGSPGIEKSLRRFLLEAEPVLQANPATVSLRVGYSYHPADPLGDQVLWLHPRRKPLSGPAQRTAVEYQARGTRPVSGIEWGLFAKARYLYFELSIGQAADASDPRSALLPVTGGACNVSGALLYVGK